MDGNFLIWSCNRKKFATILASTEEYREKLGRKLNSDWFIKIQFCKGHKIPYTVELAFSLLCNRSLEETVVTFKLLTNTTIRIEGQLCISSCSEYYLGKYSTAGLKNYLIDIIFSFPKNANSENMMEYPTLMSTDRILKTDLASMFEKELFHDVILKCNSETLKAHKSILSARSPVFEAMFNCAMQESDNDMVVIEDLSARIFRDMLYFIYCGEVQITSMVGACDMLYAAEKYQLKGLKQICLDYLKSVLTIESSIQILEIADLYDGKLKRQAMSIVKENFEDLENTKGWIELKLRKPVLAVEVYSFKE